MEEISNGEKGEKKRRRRKEALVVKRESARGREMGLDNLCRSRKEKERKKVMKASFSPVHGSEEGKEK